VLTLDAKLTLYSRASGERTIPLSEAIDTPNRVNFRPNEFLTGIILQKLHAGTRSAFEKLGRRNAMARARMNLSLVLRQDSSGRVLELRIVPGAVMPVVKRMRKAEETLLGEKPDEKGIEEASTRLIEEMVEITGRRWSTEYKVPVMRNIFKRMFKSLIE
jgi:carbon-monoxide dehydrogenase medium subunit/xanthine dehydrogenase FAD-binding subunit